MPRSTAIATSLQAPSLGLLATEPLRALLDFCAAKLCEAPHKIGDGHPVVVYPGLGAGALSTVHLRNYLRDSGFTVFDWGGGLNTGPDGVFDEWLPTLVARVRELHAQHGRKVSLVGWSLGGVYAREVAKLAPEAVRQVVTLGTPFGAIGDANHAGTIYRWLGGDTSQLTPELQARLRERPPVPTTSVYSKSDGVVCWQGCVQAEGERVQNVEVNASHLGMGTHPEVLRIVLDRLALPEGKWRPYRTRRRARR
jgi:pimeloyl-ACP methyl ester carboxylesterase